MTIRGRKGFTLIEVIVVMVLMGIVGATFVLCLTYGFREYVQAADSVALSQKARLALTKMYAELAEAQGLDTSNTGNIDEDGFYFVDHDGATASLARVGTTIVMNGTYVLVDGLAAYGNDEALFTYSDPDGNTWTPSDGFDDLYEISITLNMEGPADTGTVAFTNTVNPRRSIIPNAPKLE